MKEKRGHDIYGRVFSFASNVAKFIKQESQDRIVWEYCKQVIRSSSSVGANLEEADGAITKKDFINKVGIARKEAKESRYWLRLIAEVKDFKIKEKKDELNCLINESKEIMLILSSIIKNSRINN